MLVVYILIHMFYTRSYIELQRVDAVRPLVRAVTCCTATRPQYNQVNQLQNIHPMHQEKQPRRCQP